MAIGGRTTGGTATGTTQTLAIDRLLRTASSASVPWTVAVIRWSPVWVARTRIVNTASAPDARVGIVARWVALSKVPAVWVTVRTFKPGGSGANKVTPVASL